MLTAKRQLGVRLYLALGVLGQLLWGSYPVMAKRVLMEVPKFSLLLVSTAASLGVGAWLVRREGWPSWRAVARFLGREKALWGLAGFVVLRSVTNIYAIDMTRATWVQLVYLLTPFMVALLGHWLFGEAVPPYTYPALTLSTVGAVLVLVRDWSQVAAEVSGRDAVGLGVAFASMLSLAMYFQMVRRSSLRSAGPGLIMFQQSLAMVATYAVLTVAWGEDWGAWLRMAPGGWMAAAWVVLVVFVVGQVAQITAIGHAGATLITSLMPLRLVSALALGAWVLGEHLETPLQWVGAAVVLVTVSAYLWLQGTAARGRRRA